jgi:hypothetical protein
MMPKWEEGSEGKWEVVCTEYVDKRRGEAISAAPVELSSAF